MRKVGYSWFHCLSLCFSLHGSNLGDDGIQLLGKSLLSHPNIVSLDIGDCQLGDVAVDVLYDLLLPEHNRPGELFFCNVASSNHSYWMVCYVPVLHWTSTDPGCLFPKQRKFWENVGDVMCVLVHHFNILLRRQPISIVFLCIYNSDSTPFSSSFGFHVCMHIFVTLFVYAGDGEMFTVSLALQASELCLLII